MTDVARGRASGHKHAQCTVGAARADQLVRIVAGVLDTSRPPLASNARAARLALDGLGAMAKGLGGGCHGARHGTCNACDSSGRFPSERPSVDNADPAHALSIEDPSELEQLSARQADSDETVRRLTRAAGPPEIEALDFRRGNGQMPTVSEAMAWARIQCFAAPVARTVRAAAIENTSTPGAGPAAAI
jgi:hypothetical protein